jgi:hypothetical protein
MSLCPEKAPVPGPLSLGATEQGIGCVAQNYYRSGGLFASYWFCEPAEAAGLSPESRTKAEG